MLVYAIDDQKYALSELSEAIQQALPSAEVKPFLDSADALAKIQKDGERPDVVFSDIRMPGINGLELAIKIKKNAPDTKIIFVTGYTEYALDAFRVHANGYLLKPVLPEQIIEEIEFLRLPAALRSPKLSVRCFGSFEVFYNGEPLSFKRRQTKELFAYLIDCNGAFCTSEEAADVLWEDEIDLAKAKHRLRNLIQDMRAVFKSIGQEDILIRGSGKMAVRRDSVDCDYYRMLDGDIAAINSYHGEYMNQYLWAQITEAKLYFNKK